MNETGQGTFAQYADLYISGLAQRKRRPVKETSIAAFRAALNMAKPVLGELPLDAIESANLKRLVDHLVADQYASGTIRLVVLATKKVIASAVDENGNPRIAKNWNTDYIDVPGLEKKESELLTAKQIEDAVRQADPIIREFIATQAATGCRKGELLALNAEDFDFKTRTIRVARTRGYYGETNPKTKSGGRTVELHPDIAAMLNRLLAGRATGRLFDVTLDQVRRAFEKLGRKSHALRHFRYTHLQMSAVPNAIRDYWIGHSVAGMEKVYGHMAQNVELRRKLAREIGFGFRLSLSIESKVKTEIPDFLADVESTLINLQYKRNAAAQAVERSIGENYELRLKNALGVLRKMQTS
jgi:integrase